MSRSETDSESDASAVSSPPARDDADRPTLSATRRRLLAGLGGVPMLRRSGRGATGGPAVADAADSVEWPQYHGNAQRTARSGSPDPGRPARTRWSLDVPQDGSGDQFRTGVVAADGAVFAANADGDLLAVDLQSGTVEWSYPTSGTVQLAPAVGDGRVFLGTSDGQMVALDRDGGTEQWSVGTDGGVSTPAVRDGRVYFGHSDGVTAEILAFDAASGERRWRATVPKSGATFRPNVITTPTPAVGGETVVANVQNLQDSSGSGLVALDAATGTERWQTALGGVCYPPSLTETACYAVADGGVHRVSLTGGAVRWENSFDPVRPGGETTILPGVVTVGPETVYVLEPTGVNESGVVALNKRTGEREWRYTTESGPSPGSGISTTGSRVYFAIGGRLVVVRAETGLEEWTYPLLEDIPEGQVESRRMGDAPVVTPNGVLVKHLGTLSMVDDRSDGGRSAPSPGTEVGGGAGTDGGERHAGGQTAGRSPGATTVGGNGNENGPGFGPAPLAFGLLAVCLSVYLMLRRNTEN